MPRLPRSSASRNALGHLKLLTAVDLQAPAGLQFRGKLLRPGGEFHVDELPRPAVLLECAGSVRTAPGYQFETLWVLWAFDFASAQWRECLRTTCHDSSFTIDFAPAAHRLLCAGPVALAPDRVIPMVRRLASLIDEDLATVSSEERCAALAAIETHIANRIVLATARMPARSEWAKRLSAIA